MTVIIISSQYLCLWTTQKSNKTFIFVNQRQYSLDSKEIKPVHFKGNQPWIFIGRTVTEAEVPILGPPDVKSWLIGKDPDAKKDWRRKEKGTTEDELVGWHHWLDGREFEQTLGDGEGQRSLACCSPWGHKQLDTSEQLHSYRCCYSSQRPLSSHWASKAFSIF